MQVDVLIIGQGISGTMLSWFLHQQEKSFLVIDENKSSTASKISAGIINPVTGRRYVTAWMADDLLHWAKKTYADLSDFLGSTFIRHKNVIDFFASADMQAAFIKRVEEATPYLQSFPDQNSFNPYFNYYYGCGEICPVHIVSMSSLVEKWGGFLLSKNLLLQEKFDEQQLHVSEDHIKYQQIEAGRIIYCDGISAADSRWFRDLPFSANKGEAVLIETALPQDYIFKKKMMLAPTEQKNLFWFGSNYEWDFKDESPSAEFLKKSEKYLREWLKVPFKILEHKAAVRPATLERRPFVGFHPLHSSIGILNGMGTKGASLAPFFAHQLVQNIIYNFPIAEEADIRRFSRILTKK